MQELINKSSVVNSIEARLNSSIKGSLEYQRFNSILMEVNNLETYISSDAGLVSCETFRKKKTDNNDKWIPLSSGIFPFQQHVNSDNFDFLTSEFLWVTLENGKVRQATYENGKWYSFEGVLISETIVAWKPAKMPSPYTEMNPADVREYRCCMCPQRDDNSKICPTGPGKKEESICDFVVTWVDVQGRKYRVMENPVGMFKGHCQDANHTGNVNWCGMKQLTDQESFDKAQEALNCYAKKHNWKIINI